MALKRFAQGSLPALSENPLLRYITFIVLYFSQGIPEGITIFAIPAWMAMNGKSTTEIASYSALIMLPYSLKLILAPMMERYNYLPMGRRKPWLIFGQFGIWASIIALALVPDPLNHISLVTAVVIVVHTFVNVQDIATDSLVIDIVPIDQQGKANSFMWGSKTIGMSTSLFLGSWLMNGYGFAFAILMMSIPILLIIFVPSILRERTGEKLVPWSKGKTSPDAALFAIDNWGKLFKSFKQAILLKNSLLLIIVIFITMGSLHYMRTLLPIFTIKELGWTNVYYSKIYSIYNLAGGVIGMIIGAIVIQRWGIIRLIQGSTLVVLLLATGMAFSTPLWSKAYFFTGYIALFCTLFTVTNIGILALAMHLCWKRISALQFTFCMSILNFGLASGAALLGYLRSFLDWKFLFIAFAILILCAKLILRWIKPNKHHQQVEHLEKRYLDIINEETSLLTKTETA